MLASWTRLRRLGLVLSIASSVPLLPATVWADDDEEEEEEDDEEEEGDEEEEEEEDEEQPPVTAGGLYTIETYPISELQRPLTMTKGILELRAGLNMDMSADTAFETWGAVLNARYGLQDNVELQFDLASQLNNFGDIEQGVDSDLVVKAAIEAGIVYDLFDLRLGAVVPYSTVDSGGTSTSSTDFAFELGFPFRYAPKPEIGVVALDTFMTFNTDRKPDLTPSIGIVAQPLPQLAVKLNAKLIIPEFNTKGPGVDSNGDGMIADDERDSNFIIPVSINIQFSPNNKLDIGGEFTFPNLKPADPDGSAGPGEAPNFYDSRFLLLYGQFRI